MLDSDKPNPQSTRADIELVAMRLYASYQTPNDPLQWENLPKKLRITFRQSAIKLLREPVSDE